MSAITTVPFHQNNLLLIEHNGEPFTAMKPIVSGMGLDWKSQYAKLKANAKRWGMVIITTPSKSGEQSTSCMPVRKLPAYMASIHPSKVKPELRQTIEMYQDECDNALWSYWSEGQATNPRIERISPEQKGELQQIMSARCAKVPSDMQGKARSSLWGQLNKINGVNSYHDTKASQFEESKRLLESLTILKGVVVEQPAIETKTQTIPEDMTMIKRHKIESALIAIDSAAARCDGIHEVERLFAIAEEAQTKAIKALNDYRRDAVDAIHTAAYHARHISAQIN